jgi:hypothetical protein
VLVTGANTSKNAALVSIAICFAIFLLMYQVRHSRDTIRAKETYAYVPFHLQPFANQIGAVSHPSRTSGVRRGQQLLAVNGLPFTGVSMYLQEVEALRGRRPLMIAVRSADGSTRTIDVGEAHCTCGIGSRSATIFTYVLPPAFCVLLGSIVVLSRHRARLAWVFLALMLCLSQLTLFPEAVAANEFPQFANPQLWHDWLRVPAVAYEAFFHVSWPAWLVLFATYFFPGNERRGLLIAGLMLGVALASTIAFLGWSENYHATAWLGNVLNYLSPWLMLGAFCCAVFFALPFGKKWSIVIVVLVVAALTLLYWTQLGIPSYDFAQGSDHLLYVVPVLPAAIRESPFVIAAFACAAFSVVVLANFRNLTILERLSYLVLGVAAPFLCASIPVFFGMELHALAHPTFPLIATATGLIGIAWSVLRRTATTRRSMDLGDWYD